MQRKKILWLVSWYPNRKDEFDGDFIQRHARAAAIHHDIHVIFVTGAETTAAIEEEWNYATGLTEQIIYFKRTEGFLSRIRKHLSWRNVFRKAVEKYIEKNGMSGHVHVHVPWKAGLIALWMKRKYGIDFMITEHWGIYNEVVEDNFFKKSLPLQRSLKNIFNQSAKFISVSRFLANGIERIAGKKADAIISNVVDTSLFFAKEEKYSRFTFIHVSNMVALKNVGGILDAFKKLIESSDGGFQLIMVGNRDSEYVHYAGHLGLLNSSVFFRGEIAYREVAEEMQRCHCLIMNSSMENSPCVIGEALCCGLPVITTGVGGIPELVNETNSLLVPLNDTEAMANAMQKLREQYPLFHREKISAEASERFGYAAIAEAFAKLYSGKG